jgi:hypothetical protein
MPESPVGVVQNQAGVVPLRFWQLTDFKVVSIKPPLA